MLRSAWWPSVSNEWLDLFSRMDSSGPQQGEVPVPRLLWKRACSAGRHAGKASQDRTRCGSRVLQSRRFVLHIDMANASREPAVPQQNPHRILRIVEGQLQSQVMATGLDDVAGDLSERR